MNFTSCALTPGLLLSLPDSHTPGLMQGAPAISSSQPMASIAKVASRWPTRPTASTSIVIFLAEQADVSAAYAISDQ
jgi:hypothetical protein